jgi:hypothetical protein
MAVLSAPFDVGIKPGTEVLMKMAAVKIYQGGAVGVVTGVGYATPLVIATSNMKFMGVAEETVDNSAGSAGDKWIRVRITGLVGFNLSSLTVANIGAVVYFLSGSDDNTVAASGSMVAGELKALDSAGIGWVKIDMATTVALGPTTATTGTTATTFQIDNDAAGPIVKNVGGNLTVRADGDAAYANVTALNVNPTALLLRSVNNTPVAAAGSIIGDAAALSAIIDVQTISSDSAAKGVLLPVGVVGMRLVIINTSATAAKLWPQTGSAINGGTASHACTVPASAIMLATYTAASTWYVSYQTGATVV